MSVYSGSSNLAAKVSKIYAGVDNVARKVSKAYMGDANNVAQLIYSAETPLEISYTGTYTDEIVAMTDGTYRLLTLTGSGTLTLSVPTECDIWACGGGGSGGKSKRFGGGGGGGGYCKTLLAQTLQNLVVTIGAGGEKETDGLGNDGSGTAITGDVECSVNGGQGAQLYGSYYDGGGNGGSGGGSTYHTAAYGVGSGETTTPFADELLQPLCGGGGGGAYYYRDDSYCYQGADGGSNGGNGGIGTKYTGSAGKSGGAGGILGGGNGGAKNGTSTGSDYVEAGSDGTDFGGGGGGGASTRSGSTYYYADGGAGYQGCVMVRWPYSGGGSVTPTTITFTINGTTYTAEEGMTWAEWAESSYNTGGFAVVGNYIEANSEYVYEKSTGYAVAPTGAINANGVYLTTL